MNEEVRFRVMKAGKELAGHRFSERDLPWRKDRTPYRVFLAEMLLVRTRADSVARIFERIFFRYPSVDALANADEEELKSLLSPLGLIKRVPLLIRAARFIRENHDGQIPSKVDDLLTVPGIGPYTAAAVAAFAYGEPAVPADVNVLRFVSRLTGIEMKHPTKGSPELAELLPLLSESVVGLSAENLLDFTRLICRPRNPRCLTCPIKDLCDYFRTKASPEEKGR